MGMKSSESIHPSYLTASGPIPYNLLNDYMFRVILQENEFVLRGLIGSLLHLDQSEIKSTKIKNPIKLGEQIDNKTFVLDIQVDLNNDTNLNLELQVVNQGNWPDRSLSYLCRAYDKLKSGADYSKSKCAIHIGILEFTLFKEYPEFYASYKMLNVKNQHVFSDKFVLHVLELNQIELATDEDRLYGIDHWARLFKAKTWEDLSMIAEKNQYMCAAAQEMYYRNSDEIIQEQCRAREEYLQHERWVQEQLKEKDQALAEKDQTIAEKNQTIAEKNQTIAEKNRIIAELQAMIKN